MIPSKLDKLRIHESVTGTEIIALVLGILKTLALIKSQLVIYNAHCSRKTLHAQSEVDSNQGFTKKTLENSTRSK